MTSLIAEYLVGLRRLGGLKCASRRGKDVMRKLYILDMLKSLNVKYIIMNCELCIMKRFNN